MKYNILKKSAVALLSGVLSVATLSTSCEHTYSNDPLTEVILISNVDVNVDLDLKLANGMAKQIEWSVAPENATSKEVTFKSSDEEIVTVSEDGLITAVGYGSANISISQKSLYNALTSIKVTVISVAQDLEIDDLTLFETASVNLSDYVKVTPSTAYNVVDATVEDTAIAEFANGVLTAIKAGTTKVNYSSIDGTNITGSFNLTVKEPITLTSIEVIDPLHHIMIGSSKSLKTELAPAEATSDLLGWKSSDESIMTVDAAGRVTAVAEGSAVITAYDALQGEDVIKDQITMTVAPAGILCLDFDEINSYNDLKALGIEYSDGKALSVTGADGYAELYGAVSAKGVSVYLLHKAAVNNLSAYPYFAVKVDLSPETQNAGNYDNIMFENASKIDNIYYGFNSRAYSSFDDYMTYYDIATAPQVFNFNYATNESYCPGGAFPENSQAVSNFKFKFPDNAGETYIKVYWMYHFSSKEAFDAFMAANEAPSDK